MQILKYAWIPSRSFELRFNIFSEIPDKLLIIQMLEGMTMIMMMATTMTMITMTTTTMMIILSSHGCLDDREAIIKIIIDVIFLITVFLKIIFYLCIIYRSSKSIERESKSAGTSTLQWC